jgi:hypothetical protein
MEAMTDEEKMTLYSKYSITFDRELHFGARHSAGRISPEFGANLVFEFIPFEISYSNRQFLNIPDKNIFGD